MKKILCLFLAFVFVMLLFSGPAAFAEADTDDPFLGDLLPPGETAGVAFSAPSHSGDLTANSSGSFFDVSTDIASSSLAVTGAFVWYVLEGMIVCTDTRTGREEAAFPVSGFCGTGEEPVFVSVSSWREDSVLLCLGLSNEVSGTRVLLLELRQQDHAITAEVLRDATEELGFLFDGSGKWNDVLVLSTGQNLYLQALDSDLMIQLYRYLPETGHLSSLRELPLSMYLAGIPVGEDLLLLSPDLENSRRIEIAKLSGTDGSLDSIDTLFIDSAQTTCNFAYSEAENRLYFTLNSIAYVYTLGSGAAPEMIGSFSVFPAELWLGTLAEDRYVVMGQSGELLSCDLHGHLDTTALLVADTRGDSAVSEAAAGFSLEHPEYSVSVSDSLTEENILSLLRDGSSEFDVFVIRLNSEVYRTLHSDGNLAPLSGSAVLAAAVEDMPEYLQRNLLSDGSAVALPVSVSTFCQTLNAPALQELTGLTREELPTDWEGFLKLLQQIGAKKVLEMNPDWSLYGMEITYDEFRILVFSWLLQDTFLWLGQDESRVDRLQETLLPLLKAFNDVPWSRLGLPKDYTADIPSEESFFEFTQPVDNHILMDASPEIAVIDMADGEEYWPLSIADGERLVSQTVSVLCINPYSSNAEAALRLAEAVWAETDTVTKYTLCQSLTAPVVNDAYDDDLAYMEKLLPSLEQELRAADDPAEKAAVSAELDDLKSFLEDYRSNAYWLISENSIAAFRTLTEHAAVTTEDLWGWDEDDSATWQFLDGKLSPKKYVRQLTAALKENG